MTATESAGYISYVNGLGESHSGAEGMAFLERLLSLTKEIIGGNSERATSNLSSQTLSIFNNFALYPIETEASAATDNLRNIIADSGSGAVLRDGMVIGVRPTNAAHVPTLVHNYGGAGQLFLHGNRNVALRNPNKYVWLKYDVSVTGWRQIFIDVSDILDRLAGTRPISTLTLAASTIAPTSGVHRVTTVTAGNLDTIALTNFPEDESNFLYLSLASGSDVVTVRHNQGTDGKIVLADATNFSLVAGITLVLSREVIAGPVTTWREVGRIQSMPAAIAGGIPVGTGSPARWNNLAAPARDRMTLKSLLADANKLLWVDDTNSGEIVQSPGSDTTYTLTGTSESFITADCTSWNLTETLPSAATVPGKTFYFYLSATTSKTCTINRAGSDTIGKGLWTTTQLSAVGDLLAIRSDGTTNWKVLIDTRSVGAVKVASLGKNKNISVNNGNSMTVKLSNGQLISCGLSVSLARGSNDGYQQWGSVQFDPINPPPSGTTIVDWVFTGSNLFVVLSNGWVYAAGQNASGQLGQNDTTARYVLTRIPYFFTNALTVTAIYASSSQLDETLCSVHAVATSGTKLYAWGHNAAGQLGTSDTANKLIPVLAYTATGGATITDVQVGNGSSIYTHTGMLLSTGLLYMTGYNANGQLGMSNTTNRTSFAVVPSFTGVTAFKIWAGNYANSTLYNCTMAITSATGGSVFVWGYNGSRQGANGGTADKTAPGTALLTGVAEGGFVGSYSNLGCWARKTDNTLWTWGDGAANILFGQNTTTINTATQKFTGTVSKVWPVSIDVGSTTNLGLVVLDSTGKLHVTGLVANELYMPFPTKPNASYSTGAQLVALPKELTDGSDSIADIAFIHVSGIYTVMFLLTTNGALYSGCSGSTGTVPFARGYIGLYPSTEPSYVYWNRLNKQLWE